MLIIGKASYLPGMQHETAEKLRCALLMHYLGEKSADVIFRDANGRPTLRIPQTDISTSHSDGMVFVALCVPGQRMQTDGKPLPCWIQIEERESNCCRIGIDIEPIRREDRDRYQRIADRWFFPAEAELLRQIEDMEYYGEAFARMWTQKESACKMWGEGISAIRTINTMDLPENTYITSSVIKTGRETYLCSLCADRPIKTKALRLYDRESAGK